MGHDQQVRGEKSAITFSTNFQLRTPVGAAIHSCAVTLRFALRPCGFQLWYCGFEALLVR